MYIRNKEKVLLEVGFWPGRDVDVASTASEEAVMR
jgi:hypothetical protein